MNAFPRWTAHDGKGVVRYISVNYATAPQHRGIPTLNTPEEARDRICQYGGYVMMQKEGWAPPFVLYDCSTSRS